MGGSTDPLLTEAIRGLMPSIRVSFMRVNQPAHRPLGMYAPRARRRLFQNYLQRQQIQIQPLQIPEVAEVVEIPMDLDDDLPLMGEPMILVMEEIRAQVENRNPRPRFVFRLPNANNEEAHA
ncbi:protein UL21A [macacine betaherpesvirus 3]|uniref:Rh37 n=1 Tax=Rhesus cytomegalovirus (strain 68-1) TaxID=47929 RepID=Q7TFU4_RHCM6|nr:rh37 [macacine betaherpesvirus 3]AAP50564.1 rh37 [macacine betaherpesvirus 3]QMS44156.1 Rh37 [synthetic construct]QQL10533.1 Rh37 [Rhesus cytomegalovirus strain 68-1.2]QQL10715.1 Rh37 [Rhesus cytomegalovirus strain 68-1_FL]AFL03512.1 Rh37 [macacine betaherpesvirus 3]